MRDLSRAVALLLVCYRLLLLAQNPAGQLPTPDQNSILNLYDAFGYQKRGTILDWGFSALVRYNGKTILFDTGNSADAFEHNVKALGVDLKQVDIAVLSHRHYDHISGFDYMLKVKPLVKAYLPADIALGAPVHYTFSHDTKESLAGLPPEQLYFGGGVNSIDYKPGDRFHGANQEFVPASQEIAPGIYLIVTRSVMMGDFNAYPPNEPGHPDLAGFPELSLALKTEKGVVLITGCSHSKSRRDYPCDQTVSWQPHRISRRRIPPVSLRRRLYFEDRAANEGRAWRSACGSSPLHRQPGLQDFPRCLW